MDLWNNEELNFSTEISAPSNGSQATLEESNSMDGYSNAAVDCEVVMDTSDASPADNDLKKIRASVRNNHHRKYYQISKKDLQCMINRNDKSIIVKENTSRKAELNLNYRRICIGDKETEFVRCIHCLELLCYSSYDGTTSVTRHLTSCVKADTSLVEETNGRTTRSAVKSVKKNGTSTVTDYKSKVNKSISLPVKTTIAARTAPTIIYKAPPKPKLNLDNLKHEFSKNTIDMIINNFLPLEHFDGQSIREYFQKLIQIGSIHGNIDINSILPTNDELNKVISSVIEKMQKRIKSDLEQLSSVNLFIDVYTCKSRNERFILLSTQYSIDGNLFNRALALKQQNDLSLKQKDFDYYLKLYGLEEKNIKIVSASNPRNHFKEETQRRLNWWNCSIDQLNQILTAMIQSLNFEPKVKEIAYFVEKCPPIYHYLNSGSTELKMITNTDEIFDSRITNVVDHVMLFDVLSMMKEREHNLVDDPNFNNLIEQVDLKMMNQVRAVLNNFYEAKKFISVENKITFNLVLPCFKKLVMVCKADDETDYRINSLKYLLCNLLEKYFCVSDKHKIATFLTPKFRSLRNLCSSEEISSLIEKLKQDLKDHSSTSMKREEDNFFEFCNANIEDIGGDEVDLYLKFSLSNQDLSDDPLKFWIRNEQTFPSLSKYSIDILSIPASSTGCTEKLFTKKDLIDPGKRIPIQNRLNDFLFINSNIDLLKENN